EPGRGGRGRDAAALKVTAIDRASDRVVEHLARAVVLGAGAEPRLPAGVDPSRSERMLHSHEFLGRMASRFPDREAELRFVVVGDGQSAAEIFDFLAVGYPRAHVIATTRGVGYRPMDETPFANEAF